MRRKNSKNCRKTEIKKRKEELSSLGVCLKDRTKQREREKQKGERREKNLDRKNRVKCVYVCVCVITLNCAVIRCS